MSTVVREIRRSTYLGSKEILEPLSIFEDEADMSELELAKSRMSDSDDEFVDVDELISYLRK
jgi:hypothetical protein